MRQALTAREIRRRYDGEWVYVADPQLDPSQNLVRGRVLFHGEDSDAVYRKVFAMKERPRRFAMLWIGERPPEPVLVL